MKVPKNFVSKLKAVFALLVMGSGTVYSFVNITKDNREIMLGAGVVLVFFCISSVLDIIFPKG